jgi:ferredoxin hydrogenase
MNQISRRNFLQKYLVCNASLALGAYWLVACKEDSEWGSKLQYVPIQNDNPAIARWSEKCEDCGDCIEACAEKQKVFGTYEASTSKHVCIHCGSCIKECDEHAITEKYHWQYVLNAIDDPSKVVIASISPSVRVGIGDYFGFPTGSYLSENLVAACRDIGFKYVLDTNFSADLTIIEEAAELQKRLSEKDNIPQFTSCCPAWIKYVEIYYPSLIKNLSTTKSPVSMQGTMIKTYFAQKMGIDPENIVHVAITPCTAKKYEITREELTIGGQRCNDIVITTNELAKMLRNRNINLTGKSSNFDSFMSEASGAAMIFGNTGGVMTAALRTAYFNVMGVNPPSDLIEFREIQSLDGYKEASITIGDISLNIAVCYEMRHAKILLDQVMNNTCKYQFIEVMTCKGGCVGGAGQPASSSKIEKRMLALNNADSEAKTRFCHENMELKAVYMNFLGQAGGPLAKQYLHTSYNDKSALLFSV